MADTIITIGGDTRQLERDIQKILSRDFRLGSLNTSSFTQPLGKIKGQLGEFEKSLEASNARVVAFGASAGSIFLLTDAFKQLVKSTIDVEKTLADINNVLNAGEKEIRNFGDSLFATANKTSQSFETAAQAALEFSRQGLTLEETIKRTSDALSLAKLSGLSAADSVDALTAAVNSFNGSGLTSAQVVNKLAAVDARYAVSSADLAEAIKRVGSSASDAGVNIDQLVGLVTAAQQTTARGGAVIGNSFKTIFTRLQRPKVLEDLEQIGVQTRNAFGETLPLIQILTQLARTYDTLGSAQKSQIAELVGGVFQINILKATLADLSKEYSIYSGALAASSGATNEAEIRVAKLTQTFDSQLNTLVNNLKRAGSVVGELTIAPALQKILTAANSVLETFSIGKEPEGYGEKAAQAFLKGLGKFIAGPGLLIAAAGAFQIFKRLSIFVADASKTILNLGAASQQQVAIQNQIIQLLQRNPALYGQIQSGAISVEQANRGILAIIQAQNAALQTQTKLAAQIATGLVASGVKVSSGGELVVKSSKRTKSAGFIPSIIESAGAYAGGYKPGNIKTMNIPQYGNVVYNSAEKVVNIPGFSQPFINPPKNSKAGKAHRNNSMKQTGIDPYAYKGFVPNFARKSQKNLVGRKLSNLGLTETDKKSIRPVADISRQVSDSISGIGIQYQVQSISSKSKSDYYAAAERILSGPESRIKKYLPAELVPSFNYQRWIENNDLSKSNAKFKVFSLVDPEQEVEFGRQKQGLLNNIAGELFERSIASKLKLKRSAPRGRLDFEADNLSGYYGGEAKLGRINFGNLVAKAIASTGKRYNDGIEEPIDIDKPIKLFVPEGSTALNKNRKSKTSSLFASQGFIPNFAKFKSKYGTATLGKTDPIDLELFSKTLGRQIKSSDIVSIEDLTTKGAGNAGRLYSDISSNIKGKKGLFGYALSQNRSVDPKKANDPLSRLKAKYPQITKRIGLGGETFISGDYGKTVVKAASAQDLIKNQDSILRMVDPAVLTLKNFAAGFIPNFADFTLPSEYYKNQFAPKTPDNLNKPKIAAALNKNKLSIEEANKAGYVPSSAEISQRAERTYEKLSSYRFRPLGIKGGISTIDKDFENLAISKIKRFFPGIIKATDFVGPNGKKFSGGSTNTRIDALQPARDPALFEFKGGDPTKYAEIEEKFSAATKELGGMGIDASSWKNILVYNKDYQGGFRMRKARKINKFSGFIPNFAQLNTEREEPKKRINWKNLANGFIPNFAPISIANSRIKNLGLYGYGQEAAKRSLQEVLSGTGLSGTNLSNSNDVIASILGANFFKGENVKEAVRSASQLASGFTEKKGDFGFNFIEKNKPVIGDFAQIVAGQSEGETLNLKYERLNQIFPKVWKSSGVLDEWQTLLKDYRIGTPAAFIPKQEKNIVKSRVLKLRNAAFNFFKKAGKFKGKNFLGYELEAPQADIQALRLDKNAKYFVSPNPDLLSEVFSEKGRKTSEAVFKEIFSELHPNFRSLGFVPNFASPNAIEAMKRMAAYKGSDKSLNILAQRAKEKLNKLMGLNADDRNFLLKNKMAIISGMGSGFAQDFNLEALEMGDLSYVGKSGLPIDIAQKLQKIIKKQGGKDIIKTLLRTGNFSSGFVPNFARFERSKLQSISSRLEAGNFDILSDLPGGLRGFFDPKTGQIGINKNRFPIDKKATDPIGDVKKRMAKLIAHEGFHALVSSSPRIAKKLASTNLNKLTNIPNKVKFTQLKTISNILKADPSYKDTSGHAEELIARGQSSSMRELGIDIGKNNYDEILNLLEKSALAGLGKKNIFSKGFIPNLFDPIKASIRREMDAGYSRNEVKVGRDASLKTNFNPAGFGIYNSDEGSLKNGINLAKKAGINPKTKGMSGGFIPNFAQGEFILESSKGSKYLERVLKPALDELKSKIETNADSFANLSPALDKLIKESDLTAKSASSIRGIFTSIEGRRGGSLKSSLQAASARYPEQETLLLQSDQLSRTASRVIAAAQKGKLSEPEYFLDFERDLLGASDALQIFNEDTKIESRKRSKEERREAAKAKLMSLKAQGKTLPLGASPGQNILQKTTTGIGRYAKGIGGANPLLSIAAFSALESDTAKGILGEEGTRVAESLYTAASLLQSAAIFIPKAFAGPLALIGGLGYGGGKLSQMAIEYAFDKESSKELKNLNARLKELEKIFPGNTNAIAAEKFLAESTSKTGTFGVGTGETIKYGLPFLGVQEQLKRFGTEARDQTAKDIVESLGGIEELVKLSKAAKINVATEPGLKQSQALIDLIRTSLKERGIKDFDRVIYNDKVAKDLVTQLQATANYAERVKIVNTSLNSFTKSVGFLASKLTYTSKLIEIVAQKEAERASRLQKNFAGGVEGYLNPEDVAKRTFDLARSVQTVQSRDVRISGAERGRAAISILKISEELGINLSEDTRGALSKIAGAGQQEFFGRFGELLAKSFGQGGFVGSNLRAGYLRQAGINERTAAGAKLNTAELQLVGAGISGYTTREEQKALGMSEREKIQILESQKSLQELVSKVNALGQITVSAGGNIDTFNTAMAHLNTILSKNSVSASIDASTANAQSVILNLKTSFDDLSKNIGGAISSKMNEVVKNTSFTAQSNVIVGLSEEAKKLLKILESTTENLRNENSPTEARQFGLPSSATRG